MMDATRAVVEWLALVQTGLAYMGLTIPMLGVQLLGLFLALGCSWMFYRAQKNVRNPFDAAQMFQDGRGRTNGARVLSFIAGLTSVWVIAFLTVSGHLTPELFGAWLFVVVAGKVASEAVEKWKSPASQPPLPPTSSTPKGGDGEGGG